MNLILSSYQWQNILAKKGIQFKIAKFLPDFWLCYHYILNHYGSMYCIISLSCINVCHTIDSSVMYIYLYANDPQFIRYIWTKSYKTFARKNLKQFRKITLPLSILKCGVKKTLCHSTISLLCFRINMLAKFSKSPKNLVNSSILVKLSPKISIFLLPFLLYF